MEDEDEDEEEYEDEEELEPILEEDEDEDEESVPVKGGLTFFLIQIENNYSIGLSRPNYDTAEFGDKPRKQNKKPKINIEYEYETKTASKRTIPDF